MHYKEGIISEDRTVQVSMGTFSVSFAVIQY